MATRHARHPASPPHPILRAPAAPGPVAALCLVAASCLAAAPAWAQVQEVDGPLTPEVEAEIVEFLNDPTVLRLPGGVRVPEGGRIEGDVAVLGGSVELGGQIAGRLVVVNGDLILGPGAGVDGSVTIVGGLVTGEGAATLEAPMIVYAAPLRYTVEGGRVQPISSPEFSPGFLQTDLGFGQARLGFRAGTGYNRVEGLPVRFGPILSTAGRNPTSLEAFAIWRSVSGLNLETERLGHFFQLTQAVGGRGTATIGATAHDEVVAIEDQGVSDLETSLATFLLREDFRDYYERDGWSAFATFRPRRLPLEAVLTFRNEDHITAPIRDPWTLRSDEEPWRPLPLVGEGAVRTLEVDLSWDTRNDPSVPSDGWWLDLGVQRQIGGDLRIPASAPAPEADDPVPPLEATTTSLPRFTRGHIDVRRYARIGPTSRLSLRGVLAGSLDADPLPPQYQLALGGEGSLPGHRRFSVDCGARSALRIARTGEGDDGRTLEPVHSAYGCDRMVLFQAEFRSSLPVSWNPLPEDWRDSELSPLFDLQPVWAVFLDAGRGWSMGDLGTRLDRVDSSTRADVGVGFFLGPLGLYWSYPLNEQDRGVNFFVRLQRRF